VPKYMHAQSHRKPLKESLYLLWAERERLVAKGWRERGKTWLASNSERGREVEERGSERPS